MTPSSGFSRRTVLTGLTAGLAAPLATGLAGVGVSPASADPATTPGLGPVHWDHYLKSTLRFDMRDRPTEAYWMVLRRPVPELCTKSSGDAEDIIARTDSACLIDIHLKRTSHSAAVREGRLVLDGTPRFTRAFVSWIRPSPYADVVPARR